jgi:hypothetical protein
MVHDQIVLERTVTITWLKPWALGMRFIILYIVYIGDLVGLIENLDREYIHHTIAHDPVEYACLFRCAMCLLFPI